MDRFDELWVGLGQGQVFEDYASGSGRLYRGGVAAASRQAARATRTNNRMIIVTAGDRAWQPMDPSPDGKVPRS